eukprot:CAMPEP_0116114812 /NCGR_PEP_ID=MMETSP0329-20121206/173_1 /TAXON_ID=697910 /ORGANISM="Pseudo-nitzschia arenysensis, Strain B593" /LENGTH=287 /DNA_ID=CAMNT_0003608203 /DNA_START=76 /DNA_END=939 /DNA_ORIENTATION=+
MKCVAAVAFLSLQLAGSAFAALKGTHTDIENVVQERKRELREKSPLNKEEKEMLKRMLSDKTLRFADEVQNESNDPLSIAMRESAQRKLAHDGINNPAYAQHQPAAEIPEKVSMVLEAFQDSSGMAPPKLLAADASFLSAGTEYMFSNEPVLNVVFDTPPGANRAVYLVNQRDRIAVVSGSCTRTDPKSNYVGRAYCQLEYRFLDQQNNIEATLTAEGPITKGDINTLSVTGGTGIFRRTVGTVVLETGNLRGGSPPIFIPSARNDLPSSYIVKMLVFMDSVDLELE